MEAAAQGGLARKADGARAAAAELLLFCCCSPLRASPTDRKVGPALNKTGEAYGRRQAVARLIMMLAARTAVVAVALDDHVTIVLLGSFGLERKADG